jgi:uncharacterized NAD(P)/FAD-binding protein YdhS
LNAAVKGIQVELVPREVLSLSEDADGAVQLRWQDGAATVDGALLTTGRCPAVDPVAPLPPSASACYLPDHIQADRLDLLPLDAEVHVLGTSLSAYDIVNRLFSPSTGCAFVRDPTGLSFVAGGNDRRVVLASRSGRLKKMQSVRPMVIQRSRLLGSELARWAERQSGLTLDDFMPWIDEEAERHGVRLDWPSILDPYAGCNDAEAVNARAGLLLERDIAAAKGQQDSNFLVDLASDAQLLQWEAFSRGWLQPQAQKQYRSQVESALLCYAAPCPIPTAERLLALHRAGRLVVRRGVREAVADPSGAFFRLPHRHGVDRATVLINATGRADRRLASDRQGPLTVDLREQGLWRPFMLGGEAADGVAVDMATFRARGANNIYVANMFLWGPGSFTSSAFMMATIVEQAVNALFANAQASSPN